MGWLAAFELPLEHLHVSQRKYEEFRRGTGQLAPEAIVGAVVYLHCHYLLPNKALIVAKGRHVLRISLSGQWRHPGGKRQRPQCLAWWESVSSMQSAAAPLMRAAARNRGYFESRRDRDRIVFAALHMLDSYDVLSLEHHHSPVERG